MQEVYLLVGEILEVSQVIEYNLALVIKYSEYINKLKKINKVVKRDFANFEKDVEILHSQLMSSTLGQIITKVKEVGVFSAESIDKLYNLLKERNYLVHKFFKVNNFNEIPRFSNKYNGILQCLNDMLINMQVINSKLYNIIKSQQIEFSNLMNKCNK